ncbi:MAG: tetratricopeptide repeat protein, partial [Candidatus Binatia bacterium]
MIRASRVGLTAVHALRVAAVAVCFLFVGSAFAQPKTATFEKGLDAYFGEQPARAVTLLGDTMARADSRQYREPTLYVLGKSFAQLHLYEKAEDQLRAVLAEFPRGRFAPLAIRELARIFFDLREYGALINVEQTYR